MKSFSLVLFALIVLGCKPGKSPEALDGKPTMQVQTVDTSNTEIYDLLQIVIETEKLDKTYRLQTKLYESPIEEDSIFLQRLLIEKKPKKENPNIITVGALDKCLTQADIDFMIEQKNKTAQFSVG